MKNTELLSNAEIRLKLKNMENEYEALKVKVRNCLEEMDSLSMEYNTLNGVLSSRSRK